MLEETNDTEEIIGRVAALDIGKAELVCCVRVPSPQQPGKRLQEVKTYSTMTRSLLVLADRLGELGVTRVVMEATSDYWRPPVRHEVPRVRAEVKGLRLRPVAAGR
jgi:transposase